MSIGTRIKECRNQRGLTQSELAARVKISRSYLAGVEGDRYNPSVETLQKIAAALVNGRGIRIDGGDYRLCDGNEECCGCGGCQKHCGRELPQR